MKLRMIAPALVLIGGLAPAACGGGSTSTARPAKPGVARYPNATALVTTLNIHGDSCIVVNSTGSFADNCQGGISALTFSSSKATHPLLVKTAKDMNTLASTIGKTEAAVVGPNWIVIGPSAFAHKVQHDLGGQYVGQP